MTTFIKVKLKISDHLERNNYKLGDKIYVHLVDSGGIKIVINLTWTYKQLHPSMDSSFNECKGES